VGLDTWGYIGHCQHPYIPHPHSREKKIVSWVRLERFCPTRLREEGAIGEMALLL